jgi:chlorobactene glucosyltransferase
VVLVFSSAWLAIIAWLMLRAVNQRGLLPRLTPASAPAASERPHVTVIVPARNEAANIGRCLRSLLAQDYPADRLSVIVVDDHSTDDTAAIVRSIAANRRQVSLLTCPPLPPRWTGKCHACWTGTFSAAPDTEWLCFIDADVWGESALISSAVWAARTQTLDLLSLAPRQELGSFAERLILPCGLILLSFIQDLRALQARSGPGVTATGQFMLVRRGVYQEAGGHEAVASVICEDLEFARLLKQSGGSVLLMGGEDLLATRMYTGWRTLWPGLAKNLVDTLGGPRATVSLAVVAILLSWAAVAVPMIDAAAWAQGVPYAGAAFILACAGSAAALGLHLAATRHFRIPFYYGFLFPLGYTIGALMALDSVHRRRRGKVSWKGRTYS